MDNKNLLVNSFPLLAALCMGLSAMTGPTFSYANLNPFDPFNKQNAETIEQSKPREITKSNMVDMGIAAASNSAKNPAKPETAVATSQPAPAIAAPSNEPSNKPSIQGTATDKTSEPAKPKTAETKYNLNF